MTRPLYTSPALVQAQLPMDLPGAAFQNPALTQWIEMWSGYVDDQLAGQYQTPFPGHPQTDEERATWDGPVTPATVQIATSLLVTRWLYIQSGLALEKDDPRNSLWGQANEMLRQIRDREIILGGGEDLYGAVRSTPPMPLRPGMSQSPASMAAQERAFGKLWGGRMGYFGSREDWD